MKKTKTEENEETPHNISKLSNAESKLQDFLKEMKSKFLNKKLLKLIYYNNIRVYLNFSDNPSNNLNHIDNVFENLKKNAEFYNNENNVNDDLSQNSKTIGINSSIASSKNIDKSFSKGIFNMNLFYLL